MQFPLKSIGLSCMTPFVITFHLFSYFLASSSVPYPATTSIVNLSEATSIDSVKYQLTECPNCISVGDRQVAEKLKLEAIKKQILSKLNLPDRPNITATIPRELVLEALRKAHLDASKRHHLQQQLFHGAIHLSHLPQFYHDDRPDYVSNSADDYYGKTSEIIAFAEPGKQIEPFFNIFATHLSS